MKNKLWTFGDSYTAGILPDIDHFTPYVEYLKCLGISKEEFPECWGYQLAKKLNFEYETVSVGGSSNEEIFNNICTKSSEFKKGDIVIINWTYLNRFLWALPKELWDLNNKGGFPMGKFRRAGINVHIDEILEKIGTKETYEMVGSNNSMDSWIEIVLNYEKIIDSLAKSVGFDVYYWATEHKIHSYLGKEYNQRKYICNDIAREYIEDGLPTFRNLDNFPVELIMMAMKRYGASSISDETGGLVDDRHHFGIRGNEVQSELFYSWIMNKEYPKKVNSNFLV